MLQSVDPSVSSDPIATNAENLATCCVMCSANCGLRVDVAENRIAAVRADESNPISKGYACNKGFSIAHYVEHGQRVTHPLRSTPDGFERVEWGDAIGDIGEQMSRILAEHGPQAIALVGIGGQGNHMDGALGLAWLNGLGSNRWFNAFAQEKTQNNLVDQWMCDASPATFLHPDTDTSTLVMVMGSNPRISNRGHAANKLYPALGKDESRTLIAVDPRETETTRCADMHLRVKPGGDCYLLLGMLAVIVEEGLQDAAFLAARTSGFGRVAGLLDGIDVGEMAERSGIPLEQISEAARRFAGAERAALLNDLGIEQGPFSTLNADLIRLLLAITGNMFKPGGNVFYQQFNPADPYKVEKAPVGQAVVSGIPGIRALSTPEMYSPSLFPEEVLNDHPERIRAVITEGSNPLLSFSDTPRWREAFEALELVVVIEPAMTESARAADYVLPTPVGYEKWEISMFPKNFPEIETQLRPPVVAGPPDALPEPEIYARLGEAMNLFGEPPALVKRLGRKADSAASRGRLVAAAAALGWRQRRGEAGSGAQNRLLYWLYRTMGANMPAPSLSVVWAICFKNAITRRKAVLRTLGSAYRFKGPFAIADALYQRILDHPEGVEIARLDPTRNLEDTVRFKNGRVRLAPTQMLDEARRALISSPIVSDAFPLVLSAGLRTRWTANTIHRDPTWRKGKGPHCALSISPSDAEALGIAAGDAVALETNRGRLELPAKLDDRVVPGFVSVPNGFGARNENRNGELSAPNGVNLNEIMDAADRDPFTGCPQHKHVACRVTAIP